MITISEILKRIPHREFIGNDQQKIASVIELNEQNSRQDVIFWCNDKNAARLSGVRNGTVICSAQALSQSQQSGSCNYIIVENPRSAFREVLVHFFAAPAHSAFVSPSAVIHPSVLKESGVFVGHNTVIEENCTIGEGTYIGHNNVIHSGTRIGAGVKIGSNNTIGAAGFGYEKDEDGMYRMIPHIGGVEIHAHAEIGNNNCIDRGVLGNTIVGENVKVDNLVHIAHGVIIGSNSLIIANAMIGGSTVIGENVWVAPSATLINKIKIGDNAVIGMSAVVIKDVEAGATVVGSPAKKIR